MKTYALPLLFLALLVLTGCAASGTFYAGNLTNVELSEDNYRIVATNITGQASAEYLLGVSGSPYGQMNTFALARISGSGMLYGEAVEDLWDNFRAEHGDTEGRNLALVDVHFDTEAINLIVYTKPVVAVRATVVEFSQ